jgi:hypothetical protein
MRFQPLNFVSFIAHNREASTTSEFWHLASLKGQYGPSVNTSNLLWLPGHSPEAANNSIVVASSRPSTAGGFGGRKVLAGRRFAQCSYRGPTIDNRLFISRASRRVWPKKVPFRSATISTRTLC